MIACGSYTEMDLLCNFLTMSSLYTIPFSDASGQIQTLETYRGKVMLIVNTATECGLAPQFDGLEKLWQTHRDEGLVVLGFPCDQFAGQEPVSNADMTSVCRLNHGVTFPLMAKIQVNGSDTHPLYQYLKSKK